MFATPRADYKSHHGALPNSYAPDSTLSDRVAALERRLSAAEEQHAHDLELVVTENEGLTARLVTLEREVASLLAWARALTAPGEPGA
jgi:hypothetical protein